jgi:hypothetical protein
VQGQGPGNPFIVNFFYETHFYKVISRTQGAQLVLAPLMGPFRDIVWVAPSNATLFLDMVEILGTPVTVSYGPLGPF